MYLYIFITSILEKIGLLSRYLFSLIWLKQKPMSFYNIFRGFGKPNCSVLTPEIIISDLSGLMKKKKKKYGMCTQRRLRSQPWHLPSLIRVFTVHMKKAWVLSYPLSAQQRLWSDWVDAQADLSLHWAHMPFCWFCHEVAQFFVPCHDKISICHMGTTKVQISLHIHTAWLAHLLFTVKIVYL